MSAFSSAVVHSRMASIAGVIGAQSDIKVLLSAWIATALASVPKWHVNLSSGRKEECASCIFEAVKYLELLV
jgi:hypothetical protein